MKKARQRWKPGAVVKIDLGDGSCAFGRVLEFPLMAFYDFKAPEAPLISEIVVKSIAFKVWVMRYAITRGDWPIIGHVELTPGLQVEPLFFKQDKINGRLSIYSDDGRDKPATLADIAGLECAAVWEPEHVIDRLRDHFAGRPNVWVEMMRPKQSGA